MCLQRFWWLPMGQTILQYCKQRVECQKTKQYTQKPIGLYQPLPCPDTPWYAVHIDLITNLPVYEGCSIVLTLVDRFSKMCSFIPLNSTTATSIASAFFKEVVAHHGLPRQIVIDSHPQFTNEFWHCLMSTLKTNPQFSTAFHPQLDGMAEVSNKTLGQLLCIYLGNGQWVKNLPLLALLYNTTPQSCTGQLLYSIATGRQPALPDELALRDLKVPAVRKFLWDISRLW